MKLADHILDTISAAVRHVVGRKHAGIIVYHRISPSLFEGHVARLAHLYNIISHEQLVHAIERRDWTGMPPRSLVIHFDDGDRGFYDLGSIIKKYNIPTIHFLVSGCVGTNRHIGIRAVPKKYRQVVKQMESSARLDYLKEKYDYTPKREYTERESLDTDEIRYLMQIGVQFGAHTNTHEELPTCNDALAWGEISGSKAQLEDMLGVPVTHFAYPSGNYVDRDVEYVRQAGFRSARTMDRGWNGKNTDVFRLKDLGPGDDLTVAQLGHIELISLSRRARKAVDRATGWIRSLLKAFWISRSSDIGTTCE